MSCIICSEFRGKNSVAFQKLFDYRRKDLDNFFFQHLLHPKCILSDDKYSESFRELVKASLLILLSLLFL